MTRSREEEVTVDSLISRDGVMGRIDQNINY